MVAFTAATPVPVVFKIHPLPPPAGVIVAPVPPVFSNQVMVLLFALLGTTVSARVSGTPTVTVSGKPVMLATGTNIVSQSISCQLK
jgi:hypothetical protein